MSAIWGIIDFNNKNIPDGEAANMKAPFDKCVIDRYEELCAENVYMGCGIQYFTKEAEKEVLPICEDGIYFDADVILDNREELFEKMGIKDKSMPDGRLLFEVYKKYREKALDMLLGSYAFIYYDSRENKADLVIDCVGNRCVYYKHVNGRLYFASLIEPLVKAEKKSDINGRWITDFIAMDHLFMICEAEETPVEDVLRVAPTQYVSFTKTEAKKITYWDPVSTVKEKKYKTDEEYKDEFVKVFTEAVNCVLRSDKETSILLSGGLDSTSVVCVAAKELKKRGEVIRSYTSIPENDSRKEIKGYNMDNEKDYVLKTKEFVGNIECSFVDMPGMNPWDAHYGELEIMEMPYKSVQNFIWIPEAMRMAYKDGSRMMLTGSFGNTTISFSNLNIYMNELFQRGKLIKLYRELNCFRKIFKFSRKYAIKQIIKESFDKYDRTDLNTVFGKSFVKKEMAEKWDSAHRLADMYDEMEMAVKNMDRYRKLMADNKSLRQIGEAATKHSLATGVILRDPTKDKRVIEYCLSIPISQYVKDGTERRLVKEYLKDIVPEHVMTSRHKGKQSADLLDRCKKDAERIVSSIKQVYLDNMDNEYVDCKKALEDLEKVAGMSGIRDYDIVRHIYTAMTIEYMQNIKK